MIVTLLTDFGTADYFVAAMKGRILSRDPRIRIVDITHDIPAYDVGAAAFQLVASHASFPPGTVHLVVVDPGVGSARRPLAIRAAGHYFVGPDNGVFDLILDDAGTTDLREITHPDLRAPVVSRTFHGRDIFAPAAAALAAGFPFEQVGEPVADPARPPPRSLPGVTPGEVVGAILHIDRFGNCVTGLREADLPGGAAAYRFRLGTTTIREIRETFTGPPTGAPFLIMGSAGFFEIALDRASAAAAIGVTRGDVIRAEKIGSV